MTRSATLRLQELVHTEYPAVRRVLGSEHLQLDDDALEDRLEKMFPDADPEDVEDFLKTLKRAGRQVAPIAQRALPGMIQGATQGGMVAGPWGAVAGALGGGAMSLLSQPRGTTPARPATVPPHGTGAVPLSGVPSLPGGAARSVPGGMQPAAAQLLALLSRPETLQALGALLMGSSGRPTVSVGPRNIPAAAFANAISELAAESVEAAAAEGLDAHGDYLTERDGSPRCDVANPAERAALLLEDLGVIEAEERMARDEFDEPDEFDSMDTDEFVEGDLSPEWADDDALAAYEDALHGVERYA